MTLNALGNLDSLVSNIGGFFGVEPIKGDDALGHMLSKQVDEKIAKLDMPDSFLASPFVFRGANLEAMKDKNRIVCLAAGAESGKTTVMLSLLHYLCLSHRNLRCVMARAVRVDMAMSVVATFVDKILPGDGYSRECIIGGDSVTVDILGGSNPHLFKYSSGSEIHVVGLDRPSKVLSAELDIIYVNQAEEAINNDSMSKLITRTTGRAGNIQRGPIRNRDVWNLGTRHAQLLLDANPASETHHIKVMESSGDLSMHVGRHTDNPLLYDESGNLTAQGEITMGSLNMLKGVMRDRYLKGLWVGGDDLFYPTFDRTIHGVDTFDFIPGGELICGLDSGYRHYTVLTLSQRQHDGVIVTFYEKAFRLKRPKYIAPYLIEDVKGKWDIDLTDRKQVRVYAGHDCFAKTMHSENTIAMQYKSEGLDLIKAETGPGLVAQRSGYFLDLLGNSHIFDPDSPEIDSPTWYYYKPGVRLLPNALEALPMHKNDIDKPAKMDLSPSGEGISDDPIDSLLYGLWAKRGNFGSVKKKLEKLKKAGRM